MSKRPRTNPEPWTEASCRLQVRRMRHRRRELHRIHPGRISRRKRRDSLRLAMHIIREIIAEERSV